MKSPGKVIVKCSKKGEWTLYFFILNTLKGSWELLPSLSWRPSSSVCPS